MTIERRIQATTGIIILFILMIGSILLWNSHKVADGIDQIGTSSQVVRSAFLLRALMDEYLAHGDKRPLRQWYKRNEFLGQIINEAKGFDSMDRALLKDVEIKYQGVNSLHSKIIQLASSENHRQDLQALKETLAGMMSVRLEELVNSAESLQRSSQSLTLRQQQSTEILILAAFLLMIGILVLNLRIIRKSVVDPLQELSAGAEIIGTGNFDYVVEIKTNDEVGKLSKAFNSMIERLRASYDSLQSEIKERKQVEADVKRSNEDLEQFAYVASHDLQEPLRNVASCMQLLEGGYKNKLGPDADQLIHYAIDSVVRMKALINDLLIFSRVGTKGKALEGTNCNEILEETLIRLDSVISASGAVISYDPLPVALVDGTQLLQVFQNLISNAMKFRGGELPKVHVSAAKSDNEWVFSIRDNGMGIEPHHFDRIFVIFQRLNKRGDYQGTGMGLAIVKKIIERHRGRVWVESESGVGSTFYFTIPNERLAR